MYVASSISGDPSECYNDVDRAEGVAPGVEVGGENWPGGEDDLVFQYKKQVEVSSVKYQYFL